MLKSLDLQFEMIVYIRIINMPCFV